MSDMTKLVMWILFSISMCMITVYKQDRNADQTNQMSPMRTTVIVRDASGEAVGAWRGAYVSEGLTKSIIYTNDRERITISLRQLTVSQVMETDAEWEARGLAEGWQAQGDEGGM